MELDDCAKIFSRYAEGLGVSEDQVKWSFGMSKMTVHDEIKDNSKYTKMQFVEFLEFIGRLAHIKFKQNVDMKLEQKIEIVLDNVFAGFGLELKEPNFVVEEHSESDDDY